MRRFFYFRATMKANSGFYVMIGLIVLAVSLPVSVRSFKTGERTVSVRGLCEREVAADKAIWPISFKVVGDDLSLVYREIESKTSTVREFLSQGGIAAEDITVALPKISDKYAQEYGGNDRPYRYVASCTVTVCSAAVDKVLSLMALQSDLIKKDIVLYNDWESTPRFNFEGLNDLKPAMIEEATKNAREAAEKFAKDSGSRLGRIKTASQGVFSIEDRDSNTPSIKKVRVVTNVTYYL